ncbi:M24 family metallopeptidase [Sulfurimonas aquatica]|uniref:Xaa-Pro aminopeptidase n=1 Tax=Sulfurimonas aquatica TaxID=2672570 RepID=A0A975AYZ4_9BACT|nr:aminopeptidase P N-terminal domain-containing protein [Sulfurimonas aquatica]QSZ41172.1 M24 family metallopeptidase [Sulfurimonas aquatica]
MINEKEYSARRDKLAKSLKPYSIAVVFSAKQKTRSNDTEFQYRQNSNFYYLSGFKEDNAVLVLIKKAKKTKSYLFVQKKDETLELWTGKRVGEIEAKELFDVDDVFIVDKYEKKIKEFIQKSKNVYFDFSVETNETQGLKKLTQKFFSYENIAPLIGTMRLIKSETEIKLIRKAIAITKDAHHHVMRESKTLKNEYELQADIEHIFKKSGAYSDAYTSIVACGNAANTLHYISNDKELVNGELILIDAGCEYNYYTSDITRTIPVNGKFTLAQKELYEMVLDVQLQIIKMIRPGIKRTKLHKKSVELLSQGMISLGILKGPLKKVIKKELYKKYYPHGIGHWMGIDVHDESPYMDENSKEIRLQEGMVMTIEPGIYIDINDNKVPKKYRGIGIRIEDDILITKDGCENLSLEIAKSIKEIENIS